MSPDGDAKVPAAHQRPDALPEVQDDVEDGVPRYATRRARSHLEEQEVVARRDLEPEGEHQCKEGEREGHPRQLRGGRPARTAVLQCTEVAEPCFGRRTGCRKRNWAQEF